MCVSFVPYGIEGRAWVVIVLIPDHCLPIYFKRFMHMLSFGMFLYCKYKLAADNLYVLLCRKNKIKQEILQYVTNAPERPLILTLIPGCDLEHSQKTRVLHRT